MKRILTAAAIMLISATTTAPASSSVDLFEIRGYAPNEDLSELSELQIDLLLHIIHGPGGDGKKRAHVRSFFLKKNGDSFLRNLFK